MNISALLVTFISSISFLVGYIIEELIYEKKKLTVFSIGFAFIVLIGLVFLDLLPEAIESVNNPKTIIICVLGGLIFLKLFDLFLPAHEHNNKHSHVEHISTISCVAILLHNIIECTLIYTISLTDIKMGILMALGVSCHNIPLSIQINGLSSSNKKQLIMTGLLMLSSVIGGLVIGLCNIVISEYVLGILTCITLGMIIYISMFELLCEIKEHIKSKEMFYGLFLGVLVLLLSLVI